jgi:hypothetical protein
MNLCKINDRIDSACMILCGCLGIRDVRVVKRVVFMFTLNDRQKKRDYSDLLLIRCSIKWHQLDLNTSYTKTIKLPK